MPRRRAQDKGIPTVEQKAQAPSSILLSRIFMNAVGHHFLAGLTAAKLQTFFILSEFGRLTRLELSISGTLC